MYPTVIIHADAGLDLYRELSRPVEIPPDQPLLRGELGTITGVHILSPPPGVAYLVNKRTSEVLTVQISESHTINVPGGEWTIVYDGTGYRTLSMSTNIEIERGIPKVSSPRKSNTPWYQQFDKRRASPKPKR